MTVHELMHAPVLRTRAGCRARVAHLSLGQQWELARALSLADPSPELLEKLLHDLNHVKRRQSCRSKG